MLIDIVEDDLHIQEIETYALKSANFETNTFQNANSFFESLEDDLPDLIILDVLLPGDSGLEILKRLKKNSKYASIPVIIVSALNEEMDKVKGLDEGADDYIAKPFGVIELIARVKANLRKQHIDNSLKYKEIEMDDECHIVNVGHQEVSLTYKEYELLKLFLENKSRVLTREFILESVWKMDYLGDSRTIDMHIKSLRKKVGDYFETVRGVGYKLD